MKTLLWSLYICSPTLQVQICVQCSAYGWPRAFLVVCVPLLLLLSWIADAPSKLAKVRDGPGILCFRFSNSIPILCFFDSLKNPWNMWVLWWRNVRQDDLCMTRVVNISNIHQLLFLNRNIGSTISLNRNISRLHNFL